MAPSAAIAQSPPPDAVVAGEPAANAEPAERRIAVGAKRTHVRVGDVAKVRGRVHGARGDRAAVRLQLRKPSRWVTIDRGRTRPDGRFRLQDRRPVSGSARLRVVAPGTVGAARAAKRAGRLHVYRTAHASWYGPGLYGNPLGCGGTLGAGTVGVAHKSLPCGSKVTLRRGGRSLTVRVIDRGPYVGGREYDLTEATAQKLRFSGHGPLQVTR